MRYLHTAISIRKAYKEVKEFKWEEWYRVAARNAIKELIEERMEEYREEHWEEMDLRGIAVRHHGGDKRHILTQREM